MKKIEICPFCGASNSTVYNDGYYYCMECEKVFSEEELEFENLRQQIYSLIYMNPEKCPLVIDCVIGEDEAQGLSELEKPHVTHIFHDDEGIIWVQLEDTPGYMELNDLSLSDIKNIYNWLKENKL